MKQRVALARVLILKPEVLLMDEPFASLDAQSREETRNLLPALWRELSHTILFVTHKEKTWKEPLNKVQRAERRA